MKKKGVVGVNMRRYNAKKLREEQLARGTKPEKINKKTTNRMVPLTQRDIARITKEIEVLGNPRKK
jgi:hypothetical protein